MAPAHNERAWEIAASPGKKGENITPVERVTNANETVTSPVSPFIWSLSLALQLSKDR